MEARKLRIEQLRIKIARLEQELELLVDNPGVSFAPHVGLSKVSDVCKGDTSTGDSAWADSALFGNVYNRMDKE